MLGLGHAALVHVPLGISLVLPAVASLLTVAQWRGLANRTGWSVLVLLQAATLVGALLAVRSGDAAEETAERRGASEAAIERHEDRAVLFTWLSGGALALGAATLAVSGGSRKVLAAATIAGTMAAALAAISAGKAGGEIAHPDASTEVPASHSAEPAGADHDDDDARAEPDAPADVVAALPPALAQDVRAEMAGLQSLVPKAVTALAIGDWPGLADAADRIGGSELLANVSPDEHEALHASLPHGFVRLDSAFHEDARRLAAAARARDGAEASRRMAALTSSCAGCHARHAPSRFPDLAGTMR